MLLRLRCSTDSSSSLGLALEALRGKGAEGGNIEAYETREGGEEGGEGGSEVTSSCLLSLISLERRSNFHPSLPAESIVRKHPDPTKAYQRWKIVQKSGVEPNTEAEG